MFVMHLHHGVLWDGSDGLEDIISHLFYAAWNILVEQDGEVGPFCLTRSCVNPTGNIPEQETNVTLAPCKDISKLYSHRIKYMLLFEYKLIKEVLFYLFILSETPLQNKNIWLIW